MKAVEISDATQWNQLVSSFKYSSALQSWGWGEVKRLSGWVPTRVAIYDGDTAIGCAQILKKGYLGFFKMGYSTRGPAFDELINLEKIIIGIRGFCRDCLYLKIEPEIPSEQHLELPEAIPSETIQPENTIWIDLQKGREGLLASMENMHKRNTKLAEKRVITTAEGPEGFEDFWQVFEETNQRAKLMQHSKAYYQKVLEAMEQPLGHAFISVSRLEGKPLAAGLFVAFAGKVDYLYGGSSRENSNAKAPNGMHWGAITWGVDHGYKVYDLWGVPRSREGSHAAGIDAFKEGFGGERVAFPAYDIALSPLYGIVKKGLRLRKDLANYRARGTTKDVL